MAPQYGNKHGTLAIEPVSTRIVHKEIWEDFKVELAKKWMNYRDHDGTLLKSRVHWAKVEGILMIFVSILLHLLGVTEDCQHRGQRTRDRAVLASTLSREYDAILRYSSKIVSR